MKRFTIVCGGKLIQRNTRITTLCAHRKQISAHQFFSDKMITFPLLSEVVIITGVPAHAMESLINSLMSAPVLNDNYIIESENPFYCSSNPHIEIINFDSLGKEIEGKINMLLDRMQHVMDSRTDWNPKTELAFITAAVKKEKWDFFEGSAFVSLLHGDGHIAFEFLREKYGI